MKLSVLASVAAFLVSTQGLEIFKRPTLDDAAKIARTLISRESLVNINTIYQSGDEEGLPTSFVEYYADCGDGDPVILAVEIGTSFRNIKNGSPASLTIRTGDHSYKEKVSREYPGSRPDSVAGSPRINLRGEFKNIESGEEYDALEKCFLSRHKEAAWWLPGNPIHRSHFVKFAVKDAYFLGGFGDTGYIGKISSEDYHKAEVLDEVIEGQNVKVERIGDENIRDLAFEAYMMKHNIKDLTKSFYSKISNQIDFFKSAVDGQSSEQDITLDLSTEESETVLDIVRNKFEKRDELDLSNLNLKDLSKEQLNEIITELESLKEQIYQYGEQVLEKLDAQQPEGPEGPHGPHGPQNDDKPRPPRRAPFKGPEDDDKPHPPKRAPFKGPEDGDRPHPPFRGPPRGPADGRRPPPPPKDAPEHPEDPEEPEDSDVSDNEGSDNEEEERPHHSFRNPSRAEGQEDQKPLKKSKKNSKYHKFDQSFKHGVKSDKHDKQFKVGKHHDEKPKFKSSKHHSSEFKSMKHDDDKPRYHHAKPTHHEEKSKHHEEPQFLNSVKSFFGFNQEEKIGSKHHEQFKSEKHGEYREPKFHRESKEHKEHRESKELKSEKHGEYREPKFHRESKEHKEHRESKELKSEEHSEFKSFRTQDYHQRESKEHKEAREAFQKIHQRKPQEFKHKSEKFHQEKTEEQPEFVEEGFTIVIIDSQE